MMSKIGNNIMDSLIINNENIYPLIKVEKSNEKISASFIRKYFLQGQKLEKEHLDFRNFEDKNAKSSASRLTDHDATKSFIEKHPKIFAFLIPFLFMHTVWWTLAFRYNLFRLYPTRFQMPITMIFGATVAGMTSEGGGAVAFPIMTLLLNINTKDARDFSIMIQSCGMTSASFTIIWMGLKLEWNAIIFGSFGGICGIVFGLEYIDGYLTGPEKKMLFVAIWFSFALSLFLLNAMKRRVFSSIQQFNIYKLIILILNGFVGGVCSAFAGSGVDICSFSLLTLLFRLDEKIATPTSVVLMAVNTCVGFFWRELIMSDISQLAWEYFSVSVPVVVFCAPLGSLIASHFHRLVLASFVYVLEIAAVIGFLLTSPPPQLIWTGSLIVCVSFILFIIISEIGKRMHADLLVEPLTKNSRNYTISP